MIHGLLEFVREPRTRGQQLAQAGTRLRAGHGRATSSKPGATPGLPCPPQPPKSHFPASPLTPTRSHLWSHAAHPEFLANGPTPRGHSTEGEAGSPQNMLLLGNKAAKGTHTQCF